MMLLRREPAALFFFFLAVRLAQAQYHEAALEAHLNGGGSQSSAADPSKADADWPGPLPTNEGEIAINVRYDDYPEETSWVLEKWVSFNTSADLSDAYVATAKSLLMAAKKNSSTDGEWVVVEAYDATNAANGGGDLASVTVDASGSLETMWKFSLTDDFKDGICCDYGAGWLAITDMKGSLFGQPGQNIGASVQVFLWTDMDGATQVVDPEEVVIPGVLDEELLAGLDWLSNTTLEALAGTGGSGQSPQYAGLNWLLEHPEHGEMPSWRQQQVFAMATFLYSVGGSRWLRHNRSECEWSFGALGMDWPVDRCNEEGVVTQLSDFEAYTLRGSIPPEIGLLTGLTDLYLSNNYLSSTLPSELFALPSLEQLWLNYNELQGTLPSQVGLLTKLQVLSIGDNSLSGAIPEQVANLSGLQSAYFDNNFFKGKLSTEICNLEGMYTLRVDCGLVSCPCESCSGC